MMINGTGKRMKSFLRRTCSVSCDFDLAPLTWNNRRLFCKIREQQNEKCKLCTCFTLLITFLKVIKEYHANSFSFIFLEVRCRREGGCKI
jgi:hypothetical protein